jgi:hypothetical protein
MWATCSLRSSRLLRGLCGLSSSLRSSRPFLAPKLGAVQPDERNFQQRRQSEYTAPGTCVCVAHQRAGAGCGMIRKPTRQPAGRPGEYRAVPLIISCSAINSGRRITTPRVDAEILPASTRNLKIEYEADELTASRTRENSPPSSLHRRAPRMLHSLRHADRHPSSL